MTMHQPAEATVRKGPTGLYVLMITSEDAVFVLTSASSRGGAFSEKIRLPLPSRTGTTMSCTSSTRPCSSSTDVRVEVPQQKMSAPSFTLTRRMPSTIFWPKASAGPHARVSGLWVATYFVAPLKPSAKGRPTAVGQKPAQRRCGGRAAGRRACFAPPSCPLRWRGRRTATTIRHTRNLLPVPGRLDDTVKGDVFEDADLPHFEASGVRCLPKMK
jgi:hypothetical protein